MKISFILYWKNGDFYFTLMSTIIHVEMWLFKKLTTMQRILIKRKKTENLYLNFNVKINLIKKKFSGWRNIVKIEK